MLNCAPHQGFSAPAFGGEQALKTEELNWPLSRAYSPAAMAPLLLQRGAQAVYVVVVPNDRAARSLLHMVHGLNPLAACFVLEGFEASPYSALPPNGQALSRRIGVLYRLLQAQAGDIFICPLKAFLQNTLPVPVLQQHSHVFKAQQKRPLEEQLQSLGYVQASLVEDVGTYALRGGVLDVFSPYHLQPVRLELCGNAIETLRTFHPDTQKSLHPVDSFVLVPARECLYLERNKNEVFNASQNNQLRKGEYFRGQEFELPYFYASLSGVFEYIQHSAVQNKLQFFLHSLSELEQKESDFFDQLEKEQQKHLNNPAGQQLSDKTVESAKSLSTKTDLHKLLYTSLPTVRKELKDFLVEMPTGAVPSGMLSFLKNIKLHRSQWSQLQGCVKKQIVKWRNEAKSVFLFSSTSQNAAKLQAFLVECGFEAFVVGGNEYLWSTWCSQQSENSNLLHIVPRLCLESMHLGDVVLLADILNPSSSYVKSTATSASRVKQAQALSFSQIDKGDFVVHRLHGVGVYEALKIMPFQEGKCELMQIRYRDGDKLYVPIYKLNQVQKHSSPMNEALIDKLGSFSFHKAKLKTASKLRDVAAELLKLYAQRRLATRPCLVDPDNRPLRQEYEKFKHEFAFAETPDQEKSIRELLKDLSSPEPMDRLLCGDVGFGKTEVAMRAVFYAIKNKKQVAVIAPTTVLCMQHFERFGQRFDNWSVRLEVLNRFVKNKAQILKNLQQGQIDVIIGTHRLLSQDVRFKNLGLLIVDEEQKFGVRHKEKLRQLKAGVDTLAMSATPIPRSLNLSLLGLRDLSLIHTAPKNRWPVKTFVTHYEAHVLRSCILNETRRGGQVFFVHNRVQNLESLAHDVKQLVPGVSVQWAHGQMPADRLENTMVQFFKGQIDVLVCTKIIESGMDISNANTMIVNNAHSFGLSELYQLRGRVGRSNRRAYCYLLVPKNRRLDARAQERLQVLQDHTDLGSGIAVAQYDLEMRGAGHILGEAQSGHINTLGHELYMELLEQAVQEQRGEPVRREIEPDIQLPMAAFIPDKYMPDIRVRLSYYKTLSQLQNEQDLAQIEDELKDRFGPLPDEVINLLGLMSIRRLCCELSIEQLRMPKRKNARLRLVFSALLQPAQSKALVQLVQSDPVKYKAQPNQSLSVQLESPEWPFVYSCLQELTKMIDEP